MKIIWFSEIKWSYLRTRKQHILAKFPSSDEILFIEPISFNLKNKFNISKAFNRNIKHITIPQIQNSDIKKFCSSNYGITFPLFEKIAVKKKRNQHPIYTWLSHKELNGWNNKAPSWNFCKYLIDENGKLVNYYSSSINSSS